MVRLDGAKMSKSLGNLVFVHDLLKDWEPCRHPAGRHSPPLPQRLGLGRDLMPEATRRLTDAGGRPARETGPWPRCRSALDDDLDTPAALGAIDAARAAGQGVSEAAALLGVVSIRTTGNPAAPGAVTSAR